MYGHTPEPRAPKKTKDSKMKYGIIPPYRASVVHDPQYMSAFARHADALGFESLFVVEHAVVAAGYERNYPYNSSGEMALAEDCNIPDPLDMLAFLAGITDSIRLGTGILVAPNHHPVPLAKRCATIDVLSGGRLHLGVGVGWMREELEACGVDFDTRGRRLNEIIEVMRKLWAPGAASHDGDFFGFGSANSYPKPVQGNIPIHIGGHSRAAARRAGRLGDGFHPLGLAGDDLSGALEIVRSEAEQAGRDPDSLELTLGGGLAVFDEAALEQVVAAGADRVILGSGTSDLSALQDEMSAFAERFIAGV